MKPQLLALWLLISLAAAAQKREEIFDFSFKPATSSPYYFVTTEKKDSGWYREAFYISKKSMAMKGWYKDEACTTPHGPVSWFHQTRFLSESEFYLNGKKEGIWVGYDDQGHMTDSSTYHDGHRVGPSFHWHSNGMIRDSFACDGKGNDTQVSWYDDGAPASAGRWTGDTVKTGTWKYYHKNGKVMATEDYVNGKMQVCNCYTEAGVALDTADCKEKDAEPGGGIRRWQIFLERGLQSMLERKANSREWSAGNRTVVIRFVVEKDGSLSELTPLTNYGSGVEEEVINFMKKAPRWTPGRQWGKPVRSYHTQPLTFQIQ